MNPSTLTDKRVKIYIITGMSGSGKSTAMAAFEDIGFYCVDNMPIALLPKFLELTIESSSEIMGLAFVMDLRERGFLLRHSEVFDGLRKSGYDLEIVFLEADETVLVQRYSQTRRHHPLSGDKGILEGIRAEKEQLRPLRAIADHIIDTSRFTVHNLKSRIFDIARQAKMQATMRTTILSFGFKFGIPHEADLIVDVRFLANPYFVPELSPLNGKEPKVRDFVMDREETRIFLDKYVDLLDFLLPLYEKEGKAYLTIAVGCTGGKHRSVAVAEAIYERIRQPERRIDVRHRDVEK